MTKTKIYAEVFARFLVLLVTLPFTVVFLLFMALGVLADIFFSNLFAFVTTTKTRIQLFDQQLTKK